MGISRWGSRVEEVLNAPVHKPTLSEWITEEAERQAAEAETSEIKMVEQNIQEWLFLRLNRHLLNLAVTVNYDIMHAWFNVEVAVTWEGSLYTANFTLRDEEVNEAAQAIYDWTLFLDKRCSVATEIIRTKMIKQVGSDSYYEQCAAAAKANREKPPTARTALAVPSMGFSEEDAIESIKRTISETAEASSRDSE